MLWIVLSALNAGTQSVLTRRGSCRYYPRSQMGKEAQRSSAHPRARGCEHEASPGSGARLLQSVHERAIGKLGVLTPSAGTAPPPAGPHPPGPHQAVSHSPAQPHTGGGGRAEGPWEWMEGRKVRRAGKGSGSICYHRDSRRKEMAPPPPLQGKRKQRLGPLCERKEGRKRTGRGK